MPDAEAPSSGFKRYFCPHCGYDVSATPRGKPCPECGEQIGFARSRFITEMVPANGARMFAKQIALVSLLFFAWPYFALAEAVATTAFANPSLSDWYVMVFVPVIVLTYVLSYRPLLALEIATSKFRGVRHLLRVARWGKIYLLAALISFSFCQPIFQVSVPTIDETAAAIAVVELALATLVYIAVVRILPHLHSRGLIGVGYGLPLGVITLFGVTLVPMSSSLREIIQMVATLLLMFGPCGLACVLSAKIELAAKAYSSAP